jgi:hypothetical protein
MSDLSHKGVLHPNNGAISQFVLDGIEYGEADICETMAHDLLDDTCRELFGQNWREITVFEYEGGSE